MPPPCAGSGAVACAAPAGREGRSCPTSGRGPGCHHATTGCDRPRSPAAIHRLKRAEDRRRLWGWSGRPEEYRGPGAHAFVTAEVECSVTDVDQPPSHPWGTGPRSSELRLQGAQLQPLCLSVEHRTHGQPGTDVARGVRCDADLCQGGPRQQPNGQRGEVQSQSHACSARCRRPPAGSRAREPRAPQNATRPSSLPLALHQHARTVAEHDRDLASAHPFHDVAFSEPRCRTSSRVRTLCRPSKRVKAATACPATCVSQSASCRKAERGEWPSRKNDGRRAPWELGAPPWRAESNGEDGSCVRYCR